MREPRRGGAGDADRWKVKISCPACAAKYSIADEKVQDKLAKIRCRKCGTTIVIDGKVSPPSVHAGDGGAEAPAMSDPSAGVAPGEYSVDFGEGDQRTLSMAALIDAYNTGQVTAETYVWSEGMDDWLPLSQVPAIVDALHAASNPAAAQPAAAPSVPAQAPAAAPQAAAASPWQAAETPSALRAAARPGGGRGSTQDLFGSFEAAGSEGGEVATSAPRHDPAPQAPAGSTGARNESSVLFSLSALTSSAAAPGPSTAAAASTVGSGAATKEDSGLIDLKALTAAADAPAQTPIAQLTPAPLGMAPPLGFAPPLGGGVEAQIMAPMPQQKSRTGLFIGGGIAFAAIAIAVAIVVVSKGTPPPAPTAVATQAPPPATTTAPPATTEVSTAKPPSTGTAEEEKKDAPKTAGKGGKWVPKSGGTSAKPTTGGDTTTKPGGETKKPPAAAKSPCGCASGDLQCAMRCAAKGG